MHESELANLRDELRAFASERNWDQFHSPKNLAMALIVEAAELATGLNWRFSKFSATSN